MISYSQQVGHNFLIYSGIISFKGNAVRLKVIKKKKYRKKEFLKDFSSN